MNEITLDHQIDAAHRVVGHQGKCARLHGHSYAWQVTVRSSGLNEVGFVVDFAVIKDVLNAWDHRTLLWEDDPLVCYLAPGPQLAEDLGEAEDDAGIVRLPVNPTSEYLSALAARLIMQRARQDNPTVGEVVVRCSETPKSSSIAKLTWG